ncbi:response regulator transcription factor [Baekduia sp. Peel2402]|uniref:response regulator transcription factor n=1 Tax=Baekduia sp. Peel2402 TaxID=3458296 RepID=UPI00403ECC4B
MRVLLAEDHPGVAKSIATGLRRHGAAVDVAPDGGQALYLARVHPYDVVVLDRDLPEVHGDDVCRALNSEQPDTKVLMLTASRTTDDIVQGLSLGADDYLLKPFRFAELVARVEALARRAGSARPAVLESHSISLDPAKRTVTRDGEPIDLARKEFGVLHALMAAGGDVVSTEDLLASVWDANVDPFSNIVRMTVMKLRRKLGEPNAIETVAGVGYRM